MKLWLNGLWMHSFAHSLTQSLLFSFVPACRWHLDLPFYTPRECSMTPAPGGRTSWTSLHTFYCRSSGAEREMHWYTNETNNNHNGKYRRSSWERDSRLADQEFPHLLFYMEFEVPLQCSEEPAMDPVSLCNAWKHDYMLWLGVVSSRTMPKLGALNGIRTHDPSVRVSEDSSCLRPCGHCDRQSACIDPSIHDLGTSTKKCTSY
jgi:hypothetical protein